MTNDTSKEFTFYTDFKYIKLIKLMLRINRYEPEKICLIVENFGETSIKGTKY